MEYTDYIFLPTTKEAKARRELETINLLSEQAKRKDAAMRAELSELERHRVGIMDRLTQNRKEIGAYTKRSDKLIQFLALAEEI